MYNVLVKYGRGPRPWVARICAKPACLFFLELLFFKALCLRSYKLLFSSQKQYRDRDPDDNLLERAGRRGAPAREGPGARRRAAGARRRARRSRDAPTRTRRGAPGAGRGPEAVGRAKRHARAGPQGAAVLSSGFSTVCRFQGSGAREIASGCKTLASRQSNTARGQRA